MKILIMGASGYIGSQLIEHLQKHTIYACSRHLKPYKEDWITPVSCDLLDFSSLQKLPQQIDVAIYLAHSMGDTTKNFFALEEKAAQNFMQYLQKTTCQQILYLSGLHAQCQSKHLLSRKNVEEIIKKGPIAYTIFQAAIIIGSGSPSFEIMRDLVEKLPLMIAPKWVNNLCQPIAIDNVLYYLEKSLLNPSTFHQTFQIAGKEVLSFRQMMKKIATFRKLKRWIFHVPVLTPKLSSYWLIFITSTNYYLARSLVNSLKYHFTIQETTIQNLFPQKLLSFDQALQKCFSNFEQSSSPDEKKLPYYGCFQDRFIGTSSREDTDFFTHTQKTLEEGTWSFFFFLRHWITKKRKGKDLWGIWKVIEKQKEQVFLKTYVSIPGEAFLQIKKTQKTVEVLLSFRPKGLLGRLYWSAVFPFHVWVFSHLMKTLCKKSE